MGTKGITTTTNLPAKEADYIFCNNIFMTTAMSTESRPGKGLLGIYIVHIANTPLIMRPDIKARFYHHSIFPLVTHHSMSFLIISRFILKILLVNPITVLLFR